MKWKVTTVILAIALVLVSCGESESNVEAKEVVSFDMKKIRDDWIDDFELYEDTETHIQYIVYKMRDSGVAICPRYLRDDGTLYTEAAKE